MLSFLERMSFALWDFIRRIIALIVPFFRAGGDFRGWSKEILWIAHFVVLFFILAGLYAVNVIFRIGELLRVNPVELRNFWLPILFLLMYILGWLAWWLWKLLGPEEYSSEFPDIDQAWEEAINALNQGGIGITEAPLFLVLGRPLAPENAMFEAAQLNFTVKQTPRGDAPLHVYANRDGIYLSCPGASMLGKQAGLLAGEDEGGATAAAAGAGNPSEDMFKTLQPTGRLKDVQGILARAREEGRGPDQLTELEKAEIKNLVAEEEAQHSAGAKKPVPNLLKNTVESERLTKRLTHLCRLISRDRRPYCPINGIMILIPFTATDRDEEASTTGTIVSQDLATCRRVLQVSCPAVGIICDLEESPGFTEFLERFPAEQRQKRLGQRFPLVPDIEPPALANMIDGGIGWICQSMFPNWVYKLFRLESPTRGDVASIVRGNIELYKFMCEMRDRQKRMARIFSRAIGQDNVWPPLFAGCYVAATGRDTSHDQAFVAGVFRRLTENQNFISWTPEAIREESDYMRWTNYGYTALVAGVLALAVFAFIVIKNKS